MTNHVEIDTELSDSEEEDNTPVILTAVKEGMNSLGFQTEKIVESDGIFHLGFEVMVGPLHRYARWVTGDDLLLLLQVDLAESKKSYVTVQNRLNAQLRVGRIRFFPIPATRTNAVVWEKIVPILSAEVLFDTALFLLNEASKEIEPILPAIACMHTGFGTCASSREVLSILNQIETEREKSTHCCPELMQ